ncbi:MAG: hypothetical protein K8S25_07160 [Alphaproteobacteria bacterium]|nr:hypothetical protein [Alphaproteobacteria bacterium]
MIVPTGRAILLAALTAPLSLMIAAAAPAAWPLGPVWTIAIVALIFADAQLGRPNISLKIETRAPRLAGIGAGAITAWIRLIFGPGQTAPIAEVALAANDLVTVMPSSREAILFDGVGETGFKLVPHRRGEARLEHAHIRWQGPLRLAWCQRVEALDEKKARVT